MFNKRHYEVIARCINWELKRESSQEPMKRLIDDLCREFKSDNPAFSREHFIEACWKEVV